MRDIRAGTANHAGWFHHLHEKLKISLVTNEELKGKSGTIVLVEELPGGGGIIKDMQNCFAHRDIMKIIRTALPAETQLSAVS